VTAPRLGLWWLVAPVLVLGLVGFALDRIQLAGYLVASGLALGAVLRLVMPTGRSGGLVVRSRWVDVATMGLLAAALAVITSVLDLRPRG
jgi:hypothetical protein